MGHCRGCALNSQVVDCRDGNQSEIRHLLIGVTFGSWGAEGLAAGAKNQSEHDGRRFIGPPSLDCLFASGVQIEICLNVSGGQGRCCDEKAVTGIAGKIACVRKDRCCDGLKPVNGVLVGGGPFVGGRGNGSFLILQGCFTEKVESYSTAAMSRIAQQTVETVLGVGQFKWRRAAVSARKFRQLVVQDRFQIGSQGYCKRGGTESVLAFQRTDFLSQLRSIDGEYVGCHVHGFI